MPEVLVFKNDHRGKLEIRRFHRVFLTQRFIFFIHIIKEQTFDQQADMIKQALNSYYLFRITKNWPRLNKEADLCENMRANL